jgi:hypothetical protein
MRGQLGDLSRSKGVHDYKSPYDLQNVVASFTKSVSQVSCQSIKVNIKLTRSVNFVAMGRKRPTSCRLVEQRGASMTVSFGAAR